MTTDTTTTTTTTATTTATETPADFVRRVEERLGEPFLELREGEEGDALLPIVAKCGGLYVVETETEFLLVVLDEEASTFLAQCQEVATTTMTTTNTTFA